MVLLGTKILANTNGVCRGPIYGGLNIASVNNLTLENIFLNLCKACQLKSMASIPPTAFSAGRIRDTQRDMKVSNTSKGGETNKFFNFNFMELSPLKYNSKMMNSIWGSYNRYSPHNVKKVNDANNYTAELQHDSRSAANFPNKTEPKLTLPTTTLDNVWAAVNVSQSH